MLLYGFMQRVANNYFLKVYDEELRRLKL